jgi:CHRD domain
VRRHVAVVTLVLVGTASVVFAQGFRNWRATLSGYNEVPVQTNLAVAPGTLSSPARASFTARISRDETEVEWTLRYRGFDDGTVNQAHIHFGDVHTNGGISVFLCTNLGNGPAGTQACPQVSATIKGTFAAADVLGPAPQGIAAGEFEELLRAIRARRTYANIHSARFPSGEIRGQIFPNVGRNNDDDDNSGHGH